MTACIKTILFATAMGTSATAMAGAITYVDATDGPQGNTVMAPSPAGPVGDGVAWETNAQDRIDNIWRKRIGFGLPADITTPPETPASTVNVSEGTIYESTGLTQEGDDAPRLKTMVNGLPSATYDVYVYFWSDQTNSPWQIRAGLSDWPNPLTLYVGGGAPSGFRTPVLIALDEAKRKLFQVKIGQTTGTSISVFVEDEPDNGGNGRTWYDGIGYTMATKVDGPNEQPAPSASIRSAANPEMRLDENSQIAHQQLVAKAKTGGIDLYFLGDSITRRWGCSDPFWSENLKNWRQNFFGWNAGNFGWGADGIQHILWRIQNGELDGVNPKVIVISGGTNNIGNKPRSDEYISDMLKGFEALIATCREKAPHAKIILTAIFPRNDNPAVWPNIQAVNKGLAELADGETIFYLNVNDKLADADGMLYEGMTIDNLHLSVKGYQVWADGLQPLLMELMGPPAQTDHAPLPTGDPSISRPDPAP